MLQTKRAYCLDEAEGRNGTGYVMTERREREGRKEERNQVWEGVGKRRVFNS